MEKLNLRQELLQRLFEARENAGKAYGNPMEVQYYSAKEETFNEVAELLGYNDLVQNCRIYKEQGLCKHKHKTVICTDCRKEGV